VLWCLLLSFSSLFCIVVRSFDALQASEPFLDSTFQEEQLEQWFTRRREVVAERSTVQASYDERRLSVTRQQLFTIADVPCSVLTPLISLPSLWTALAEGRTKFFERLLCHREYLPILELMSGKAEARSLFVRCTFYEQWSILSLLFRHLLEPRETVVPFLASLSGGELVQVLPVTPWQFITVPLLKHAALTMDDRMRLALLWNAEAAALWLLFLSCDTVEEMELLMSHGPSFSFQCTDFGCSYFSIC